MYSKFDVTIDDHLLGKEFKKFFCLGQKHHYRCRKDVIRKLDSFFLSDQTIDGKSISEEWFPAEKYDVFLSHSHKDLEKVLAFAGWLDCTFDLRCFVDSCTWDYCDNLLKQIDDKYCKNEHSNTYSYTKRNYSTSHVHMMLSIALSKVMDLSECVMFINTPHSISVKKNFGDLQKGKNCKQSTASPWIYHELFMSTYVRITRPERLPRLCSESMIGAQEGFNNFISHDVSDYLREMRKLTFVELAEWKNKWMEIKEQKEDKIHPLDLLYKIAEESGKIKD